MSSLLSAPTRSDLHLSRLQLIQKRKPLAETVTSLSEGFILTLAFGMIQVNYAFPQDLTAKISPHNVNYSKVKKYRL